MIALNGKLVQGFTSVNGQDQMYKKYLTVYNVKVIIYLYITAITYKLLHA
jgi:hypothetical protein